MREFLETIRDQLKSFADEGNDSVALDDESIEILRRLASSSDGAEPAQARSNVAKVPKPHTEPFVDNVEPVKFVSSVELAEPDRKPEKLKKLQVSSQSSSIAPIPSPTKFKLPEGDKALRWNALKEIVLKDPVCNAHIKAEKKVVFGVGNLNAKIFFCGEAPGADEEIQGEPFVGKAGQLLTKIIGAMGLSREEVYIGNIMNWRPEVDRGNRPPTEEEMAYCLPYLKAQVEIVNPQIIVALGMTAVNGLLGANPSRRMKEIRGKWQSFDGRDLMITYHPSFLLQYASNEMKRLVWEDMMAVMLKAGMEISDKQKGYFAAH